jgi:hypothetical protein
VATCDSTTGGAKTCQAGYELSGTSGASGTKCNTCATGKYRNSVGTTCASCSNYPSPVTACNPTTGAATECAAGYYLNSGTCSICPAGNSCAGGTSQPVLCAPGTYAAAGSTSCSSILSCPACIEVILTETENAGSQLEWTSCGPNYKYQVTKTGNVIAETTNNVWTIAAGQELKSNTDAYVINAIDKSTEEVTKKGYYFYNITPFRAINTGDSLILSWEKIEIDEYEYCNYTVYKDGHIICNNVVDYNQCVDTDITSIGEIYSLMPRCLRKDNESIDRPGFSNVIRGCDY